MRNLIRIRLNGKSFLNLTKRRVTKPKKGKLSTQQMNAIYYKDSGILRGKTIKQVVFDEFAGVDDTDWFKVIKSVKESTRPNT